MKEFILLLSMLFCHIVDDYYLQGWLASAKQKTWWEKNAPDKLYKNDYKCALIEHAFSWTCMVHFPVIVYMLLCNQSNVLLLMITFAVNWIIHAFVDNLKANKLEINLCQDQVFHLAQIVATFNFVMIFTR